MGPNYDYLIVGAGLFGLTFAHEAVRKGKRCAVIDQRNHIGGNCHSEKIEGIEVHKYGAHIFHTDNERVWKFVNQFTEFNNYVNQPISIVGGKHYNLPFNMNMFAKVFGTIKPDEVQRIIQSEIPENIEPKNLEEQAISLVGETIYKMFIKGYSEKQWGKSCKDLSPEYIKRLPLRFTFDNNYFNDKYQGVPVNGYSKMFENMAKNIVIMTGCRYQDIRNLKVKKTIYTGMIDEYFDYKYGSPEYRSLQFVHSKYDVKNYQGNAVINYPTHEVPYTRSIEHKHFSLDTESEGTIVTYEFPMEYKPQSDMIPYYPVGNSRNQQTYNKYLKLSKEVKDVVFAGRLGSYQYYDMDDTIDSALQLADKLL